MGRLYEACSNGNIELLNKLLQNPRCDPSCDDNSAIIWASSSGHLEVVKRLLLDPRVDPSADHDCALREATKEGHLEVVKSLLEDHRVNPNNYLHCIFSAVEIAYYKQDLELIDVLACGAVRRHTRRILKLQAIKVAKQHIFNWLTLPRTSDGRLGIDLRIGLGHLTGGLGPLT